METQDLTICLERRDGMEQAHIILSVTASPSFGDLLLILIAHLPPSWAPNSRHMATMGTAMAKHCDPPLWLEFIGPGVGLDPSWLIRMHQWEFGNRIELFQPHLAAQWNRDVSLGIIGDLFSQEDGGAGRTGQQCKRILQSQKELCRQESN